MNGLPASLHFCSCPLSCCWGICVFLIGLAVLSFVLNHLPGACLHCTPGLSQQSFCWQNSKLSSLVGYIAAIDFYPGVSFSLSVSAGPGFPPFKPGDPQGSEELQHPSGNGRLCQAGWVFLARHGAPGVRLWGGFPVTARAPQVLLVALPGPCCPCRELRRGAGVSGVALLWLWPFPRGGSWNLNLQGNQ